MSKVLERVVYNHLYVYLTDHSLLTWRNSGFKPLDSTVNQLIFLTHKIHEALDQGKDVCMVFLDISKAFDKVYHDGLIYKLQTLGITGPLLNWFRSYLHERKQRVVLKGQTSSWQQTNAGVPQGSILGPVLFLVFINDLVERLKSNPFLFADDTSLFEVIDDMLESSIRLNSDLAALQDWSAQWRVVFNELKTVCMVFSRKLTRLALPPLFMNNSKLRQVESHKHLGLTLSQSFTWDMHIINACNKANIRIGILKRLSRTLSRRSKETVYLSFIRPILEYGSVIYDGCTQKLNNLLEGVQRQAALACTGAYVKTSHSALLTELGWDTLVTRREYQKLCYLYKMTHGLVPNYLSNLVPPLVSQTTNYNLRNANNLIVPRCRTVSYLRSFLPSTIRLWNGLDPPTRCLPCLTRFRSTLRKHKSRRPNQLYSFGTGYGPLNHGRLRMGLSGLNHHRHKYNFIESSKCDKCNFRKEDCQHYLLKCPRYAAQRQTLLASLSTVPLQLPVTPAEHTTFTNLLLNGSRELNLATNIAIFLPVFIYIHQTRRF